MLIGYARILKSEAEDTTSQADALHAVGCEKLFEEFPTGGRWDRPQLKQMLDELRPEDVVVVTALDRLAGSLTDLLRILEKIDKGGVYFRSLSESVDTSSVPGRMMMRMLRSIADFERSQVRARTDEGQRSARARGNAGGHPPKLSPSLRSAR
jgi:DNA invertase Pin-like site-specific DNA recombinase